MNQEVLPIELIVFEFSHQENSLGEDLHDDLLLLVDLDQLFDMRVFVVDES